MGSVKKANSGTRPTGMQVPGADVDLTVSALIRTLQENIERLQSQVDDLRQQVAAQAVPVTPVVVETPSLPTFEAGTGISVTQNRRHVQISAAGDGLRAEAFTVIEAHKNYLECEDGAGRTVHVAKPYLLRESIFGAGPVSPAYAPDDVLTVVAMAEKLTVEDDDGDDLPVVYVDLNTGGRTRGGAENLIDVSYDAGAEVFTVVFNGGILDKQLGDYQPYTGQNTFKFAKPSSGTHAIYLGVGMLSAPTLVWNSNGNLATAMSTETTSAEVRFRPNAYLQVNITSTGSYTVFDYNMDKMAFIRGDAVSRYTWQYDVTIQRLYLGGASIVIPVSSSSLIIYTGRATAFPANTWQLASSTTGLINTAQACRISTDSIGRITAFVSYLAQPDISLALSGSYTVDGKTLSFSNGRLTKVV